jgi:hypothetical protein
MFSSLRRALPRLAVLAVIGFLFIALSVPIGRTIGPTIAPVLFNIGVVLIALAVGDGALRILQPQVDAQQAAQSASETGHVYLGRCILAGVVLLVFAISAHAEQPPASAMPYLPILKSEQLAQWPDLEAPSVLGAQVEQETCPSLKSSRCWNPRTQLRTSREQGIGLGQLTRTWRKDGSVRFDALQEMVQEHPDQLAGLSWDKPYDPRLQLRALVLKDRAGFEQIYGAASFEDRMAFTLAGYNGGAGGVRSDRVLCEATEGCDASRWFGNVERTSMKASRAAPGYGKSFFEINREYVRNILRVRRVRYLGLDA